MSGPRNRPPLDDVSLDDLPGAIAPVDDGELRRRAALAREFEEPGFVARGADAGHIRLVRAGAGQGPATPADPTPEDVRASAGPEPPPAIPASGEPPARRRRSDEPNFTVRLPEYVQQALRLRAVGERTTVRLLLLRLLRDAGYHVDDEDMTDDRGIVAKRRARTQARS